MKLKCNGVARESGGMNAISFYFNRRPTDEEMRYLHEVMQRAAACSPIEVQPDLRVVKP